LIVGFLGKHTIKFLIKN